MGRGLWRGRGLDLQCCSSRRAGPPSSPHLKHRSQALLSRKPPKREMLKKKNTFLHKTIVLLSRAGRVKTTVSDNDYFQNYYLYRTTHVNAQLCHTHRCPNPSESLFSSPSVFIQAKSQRKGKSHCPPGDPQAGSPSPQPHTAFKASPTSADPTPGWLMSDQLPS